MYHIFLLFLLLFPSSIKNRSWLNSTVMMDLSVTFYSFFNSFFTYFENIMLGGYMFRIAISLLGGLTV